MGLDIAVRICTPVKCACCGNVMFNQPIGEDILTEGRVLYDVLDEIGYGDAQYGKYITLTDEQARKFANYCRDHEAYNWEEVVKEIGAAVLLGNVVELEADW